MRRRGGMVNEGVVNARSRRVLSAHFCKFFPAFARFPRSKDPVKYTRGFGINQYLSRIVRNFSGQLNNLRMPPAINDPSRRFC
jgi:hypothetical protein